jgi:hypothetical protein
MVVGTNYKSVNQSVEIYWLPVRCWGHTAIPNPRTVTDAEVMIGFKNEEDEEQ